MKNRHILTLAAATLLAGATVYAQAPGAPAPTTPPGTATGTSGAVSTGTTTGAPGTTSPTATKPKPFSSAESKAMLDLLSAMQFHVRMAEVGKQKNKDDKELVTLATKNDKEITDLFTPTMSAAQNGGVNSKGLMEVATVSKGDKSDIDKLAKAKPEKWKQEYFELLAKNGKRNARAAENAAKTLTEPTAKDLATKTAAVMASQTAEAETKYKELKEKK